MNVLRIEYDLPLDNQGRDAALIGVNRDGEMRWTIEAGRDHDGPLTQVDDLSTDQMRAIAAALSRFQDGLL
ncbi:hypothetical protein [Brevundimonas vesicularis]|uniref:hypothetical protein n=1 Tax=Brevundimonas vesicularis TaxID=41276 RepID=UPI0022ABCD41|nr:hypothetical protein [Brevundimonas vesicularis]